MDLPFKSIIRGIRATVNGVFIFFSLFRKILIFYCFEKSSNIAKIFLDNGKKNLRVNLHVVSILLFSQGLSLQALFVPRQYYTSGMPGPMPGKLIFTDIIP